MSRSCLGWASSARPQKSRWFEVGIYREPGGIYRVRGVGRTVVPGEEDWDWEMSCETADRLVDILHREDPRTHARYIPRTSQEALRQAAEQDPLVGAAAHDTLYPERSL